MYGHMTHWLKSLANGRVVLSLEGGYNINSISYAMTMCTKSLLGDPLSQLDANMVPCPSAVNTIKNVIKVHKKYWPNLGVLHSSSLPVEGHQEVLPTAKVPRAKPTERLCSSSSASLDGVKLLEEGLQSLKIVECVNNQDKMDDGKPGASGSTSEDQGAAGASGASASGGGQATLMGYLQDNLQVI